MLLCRALVGLGEGVAPTSATDMVARVCRQEERSRAIGFILSGLHAGALAGLLVAPILIEKLGWPAVRCLHSTVLGTVPYPYMGQQSHNGLGS